jgi:hypothetical protein
MSTGVGVSCHANTELARPKLPSRYGCRDCDLQQVDQGAAKAGSEAEHIADETNGFTRSHATSCASAAADQSPSSLRHRALPRSRTVLDEYLSEARL